MKRAASGFVRPALLVLLLSFAGAPAAGAADVWPHPVHDRPVLFFFLTEVLEYRQSKGSGSVQWDAFGWVGGDYNRLWLKSEGEHGFDRGAKGRVDAQILYGRLVAPFWDLQIGLRQEWKYGRGADRTRTSAVIAVQGLAPYWFDFEPSVFVSDEGDVSARIAAEYDLLLTQRLILQPRFETAVALQRVEEFGVGRGINDVEASLRLRYELRRKLAPYVGLSWRRDLGQTATLARREGKEAEEVFLVGGVRLWF